MARLKKSYLIDYIAKLKEELRNMGYPDAGFSVGRKDALEDVVIELTKILEDNK